MTNITLNSRLWSHPLRANFSANQRVDLTQTLHYSSAVKAVNGTVKGSFYLSDQITQYRMSAYSFDRSGKLGYNEKIISVSKPVSIDYSLPVTFTLNDTIFINVTIYNNMNQSISANLHQLVVDPAFVVSYNNSNFTVKQNSLIVRTINITALGVSGNAFIFLELSTNKTNVSDSLQLFTKVLPMGTLVERSFSGFLGNAPPSSTNQMMRLNRTY